jgi:uncharacterized membrane protein
MNTMLWIIQGLLAAMFLMAGFSKTFKTKEKLEKQFPWVIDFGLTTIRLIGLSELLGAVGLLVPWLTGILPILTPVSAIGICLIMVLATNLVHLKKKEYQGMATNIVIFLLSAFVAYGRF